MSESRALSGKLKEHFTGTTGSKIRGESGTRGCTQGQATTSEMKCRVNTKNDLGIFVYDFSTVHNHFRGYKNLQQSFCRWQVRDCDNGGWATIKGKHRQLAAVNECIRFSALQNEK